MRKAYKYRLYPNVTTEKQLSFVLARCRELYNAALQERKEAYKYTGRTINVYEQKRDLVEIKQDIRPEYADIGSHVLQDVLFRLENAYKRFFDRVKKGEKPGFPRFQGKGRYTSFCYPDQAGWKLTGNTLHLTKIGRIKVKLHRDIVGKIKTLTIKQEGDHWYAVFSCEVEAYQQLAYTDETVGIDLGTHHFAALSTGDIIDNPRHYRKAEKKIKALHQACARKKNKRSHRRRRAYQKLSRAYRKVRNQRADFLHQWSRRLVDTYDTLVFEDLAPSNLSKRPKPKQDEETGQYLPNGAAAKGGLNKSILDAGWGQFQEYCSYKAACAGRSVLFVNPHKTSQICPNCGTIRKKELSERWHSCECGCELDRDVSAAKVIRDLGCKQLLGGKHPTLEQSA